MSLPTLSTWKVQLVDVLSQAQRMGASEGLILFLLQFAFSNLGPDFDETGRLNLYQSPSTCSSWPLMHRPLITSSLLCTFNNLIEAAAVSYQSPQLDTGYIAQHLVSHLTGIPGAIMRGKGLDLVDGSEIKSASSVAALDSVRFNHSFYGRTNTEKEQKLKEWL